MVAKNTLPNGVKIVTKECVQSEKLLDDIKCNSCNSRTKSEVKSSGGTQQVLKKNTSKQRDSGKNKKALLKKKPEIDNETNKCKSGLVTSSNNKKIIQETRINNADKSKIVSLNHKLTEYFSDLKVNEHIKENVEKVSKIEKVQIQESKQLIANTVTNQKQSSGNSKNSGKNIKQDRNKTNSELTNHKVTDYFHVRRSERKYTKKVIDEKQIDLENKILNEIEDGLEIKEFEDKGRGIITTKEFYRGDFVIEYIGDLIHGAVAKKREIQYAKNKNIGCYMYYFKHKNTQYCIDATKESGKLGRLINHSRKGNLVSRIVEINQIPHLVLFAKTDVSIGTEILYDYGDRSRESVQNHPWLTL
ncbi:PREDICTED: N-lysine methyltransferase SETD8-B-like [Ceratosolen solmsi marchali]|uniref:[histone H4]-lysine(20) N-methyltransferase n=1 Tax=Ceratosolen solmsi marchali TaxID=326594 RepID=A0AAJ6VIG1_9HYME|nr:PREDICTED: N-lysine methyltransferase SETD8-B-like [Ceratosolen solmsi marchali]